MESNEQTDSNFTPRKPRFRTNERNESGRYNRNESGRFNDRKQYNSERNYGQRNFSQRDDRRNDSAQSNELFEGKKFSFGDDSYQSNMQYIYGRRSVAEALRSGREIEKIFIEYGVKEDGIKDILSFARKNNIPMTTADKGKFKNLEYEAKAGTHSQGVIAIVASYTVLDEETLFANAKNEVTYPLIVAVDGITDPHNLGAIARSIECSGAQGLLIPIHNSAPITSSAMKTSAGALEYLPIAKATNLNRTLERAKEDGWWVIGTDSEATNDYTANLYDRPIVLVIGSEGEGLRPTTRKFCDAIIRIPIAGKVQSLNASVAAGVVLFEIARQRSIQKTNTANEGQS
jgi:23S rRNA (guanosine2251-2'-O)-methyltransferase